jgi:3-oxoacyl-[acyl-carrier-protein] synthase-3
MNIRIIGTGSALPKLRATNEDLTKFVDTTDEWIKSRTGIEARHIAVEETTTSLSADAASKALADAGIAPEEVDLILAGTVTPDRFFPSLACEVQSAIGAKNAIAFDISAACSGFLFGVATAKMYMESGAVKTALVIGAETLSKILDWDDRSTCVLFGDGAGAAVVQVTDDDTDAGRGILSVVQGSDGAKGMALYCNNRPVSNPYAPRENKPEYTFMNGQEVYKFAVRTVPKAILEALEKANIAPDEIDCYVLHQANIRIIEGAAKRLGQPMEKFPTNMQECGNISAASVPILLDEVNRSGRIKRGDKIVLAGFGAGLTWSAAVVEW